jgi:hypothetical protein
MSSINEQIAELYTSLFQRSIDVTQLNVYFGSIKNGNMTLESLKTTLINSPEYKESIVRRFSDMCNQMIGFCHHDIVDTFWSNVKGQVVTDNDIEQFIRQSKPFTDKCKYNIKVAFDYMKIPITDDASDFYLSKFQNDSAYTTDTLLQDLSTHMKTYKAVACKIEKVVEKKKQPIDLDIDRLYEFEKEFYRPMFVQEYFKYILNPDDNISFHDLYQNYTNIFNEAQNIHQKYTNELIDEWKFVYMYLDRMFDKLFLSELVDELISSEKYRIKMCSVISEWYNKMFDTLLTDKDINYIFSKVKTLKSDLISASIIDQVKQYQSDTDMYIGAIFTVYQKILGRQPDMYETDDHLYKFRMNVDVGLEALTSSLESDLIATLEFHDILKGLIKSKFTCSYPEHELHPSKLYGLLSAMLQAIDKKRLKYEDVEELVTKQLEKFV